jgi:uncharacterized DUF497 family protein
MKITWDEAKRDGNKAKHGLDLADAERFDWLDALTAPTRLSARGSRRFKATGLLDGTLVTIVFAPLGSEALAVISLRPASRKERKLYEES